LLLVQYCKCHICKCNKAIVQVTAKKVTPLQVKVPDYTVPRTRPKYGNRAFSVAGPDVWNSLPAAVSEADSL